MVSGPVPRLVVGAAASGSGKTTISTGLMAALRERGDQVAGFKVGPDYIDPGYHTVATGRPGRNLDPVLVGGELVRPLFAHGAAGADVAVVEGVMGLFDGRLDTGGLGSTAHVAKMIDAPVLFVVDGRGQGDSLAALLHGFRGFDPGVRFGGVILNQVGSARHERVLTAACRQVGLEVLGCVPRESGVEVPSRHLGLVTAVEHGRRAREAVAAMARIVGGSVDLAAVRALASAPAADPPAWSPVIPRSTRDVRVAVAGGSAFTFGYQEMVEVLAAAGARVVVVDPLRDSELPAGISGLVLPGGFPETHAAALSANAGLRRAIAGFAAEGGAIHAECGGLLYLCESIDDHPMCGVLPARARMGGRLTLGYRDAVAATDGMFRVGERITGHEFHRTVVEPGHGVAPAWRWRDGESRVITEGFVQGAVHASYLHTHPAAAPEALVDLVARGGL